MDAGEERERKPAASSEGHVFVRAYAHSVAWARRSRAGSGQDSGAGGLASQDTA